MENSRTVWKIEEQYGKLKNGMENSRTVWKIQERYGKFNTVLKIQYG